MNVPIPSFLWVHSALLWCDLHDVWLMDLSIVCKILQVAKIRLSVRHSWFWMCTFIKVYSKKPLFFPEQGEMKALNVLKSGLQERLDVHLRVIHVVSLVQILTLQGCNLFLLPGWLFYFRSSLACQSFTSLPSGSLQFCKGMTRGRSEGFQNLMWSCGFWNRFPRCKRCQRQSRNRLYYYTW